MLSLLPNFNAVLRDAVRQALPGAPFLVLLTDFADFPPHFWMEPELDRVIVASDHAADQARALGLAAGARSRAPRGMVLHPRFYPRAAARGSARRARAELGIPDGRVRGAGALRRQGLGGDAAADARRCSRALAGLRT